MYVIIAKNMNLVNYFAKNNSMRYDEVARKLRKEPKTEVVMSTPDRTFALLALFDGAKVYETYTLSPLIPACDTKEQLMDKLIDTLLETLGIRMAMKGYDYLKYMIKRYVKDDYYCINPMGTIVYPECAKEFHVSPATVAKNANGLIKYSYERSSLKYKVLFAHTGIAPLREAPKSNEFLPVIGGKIRDLII